MRQRVEDLGRLAVILDDILDMDLFAERSFRNKDYLDHLASLSEQNRDDVLHAIPYKIDEVKEKLYEALEIAKGLDELNIICV